MALAAVLVVDVGDWGSAVAKESHRHCTGSSSRRHSGRMWQRVAVAVVAVVAVVVVVVVVDSSRSSSSSSSSSSR